MLIAEKQRSVETMRQNRKSLIYEYVTEKSLWQVKRGEIVFERPEIKTVDFVLQLKNLTIPNYQRSYKWGVKSVGSLLDDIELSLLHNSKSG